MFLSLNQYMGALKKCPALSSVPVAYSMLLLLATVLQLVLGNITPTYFAFPANILLGAIMCYALWYNRKKGWLQQCATLQTTLLVFALMAVVGLIMGLYPQLAMHDLQYQNTISGRLGLYQFTTSWIFIISLLLFLWTLGAVTVRRLNVFNKRNVSFFLSHFGLWLAVFAGVFGSSDMYKVKIAAYRDRVSQQAYEASGNAFHLPYQVSLNQFQIDYSTPDSVTGKQFVENYAAVITLVKGEEQQEFLVRVNHPVTFCGDKIYLSGYDVRAGEDTRYCILQVVHQPWAPLIFFGIILMLGGFVYLFITGFRAKKSAYELE